MAREDSPAGNADVQREFAGLFRLQRDFYRTLPRILGFLRQLELLAGDLDLAGAANEKIHISRFASRRIDISGN